MSTVAHKPRAGKVKAAPAPAPSPAPSPVAPPPVAPAEPLFRHGTCALVLYIGGTRYKVRPCPPPPGLAVVWTLTKRQPDPLVAPVAYAVASDGTETKCTCPDHIHSGATCKHIGALRATGLLPAAPILPKKAPAAPPIPEPNGRIEEGWQPGGKSLPVPSPEGIKEAVKAEVKRLRKAQGPEPCLECGAPLTEEVKSPDPAYCRTCFAQGQEGGGL